MADEPCFFGTSMGQCIKMVSGFPLTVEWIYAHGLVCKLGEMNPAPRFQNGNFCCLFPKVIST